MSSTRSNSVAGQFCATSLFADNGAATLLVPEPPWRVRGYAAPIRSHPTVRAPGHRRCSRISKCRQDRPEQSISPPRRALCVYRRACGGSRRAHRRRRHAASRSSRPERRTAHHLPQPRSARTGPLAELARQGRDESTRRCRSVMFENGRVEGPPLYGVGHRASYAAGVRSATSSRWRRCSRDGGARTIDVAIAEVAASMSFNRITQFSYNGEIESRDIRTIPRHRALRRRLGEHLHLRQSLAACAGGAGSGSNDLVDDPRFANEASRLDNWPAFIAELDRAPCRQAGRRGCRRRPARARWKARAMAPSELFTEPQLASARATGTAASPASCRGSVRCSA